MITLLAKGINFQVDTGSGFNQIFGITTFTPSGTSWDSEDCTSHDSETPTKSMQPTIRTDGDISLVVLWDGSDDTQNSLRTLNESGALANFQFLYPKSSIGMFSFSGFVSMFSFDDTTTALLKAKIKITPVGLITDDPPVITSVTTAPSAGSSSDAHLTPAFYHTGDEMVITVKWDEYVLVDTTGGTPHITLDDGGGSVAVYTSGTDTNVLTFTVTFSIEDNSIPPDVLTLTALVLNGGTIVAVKNGNAATLTLNNVQDLTGIAIN